MTNTITKTCWRCHGSGIVDRGQFESISFCHCALGHQREHQDADYCDRVNRARLVLAAKIDGPKDGQA